METNTAETLDTWAVTAAYQHPTPRLPAPSWSCGGYENPNAFDPADQDALVEAQAVCAGCEGPVAVPDPGHQPPGVGRVGRRPPRRR